jgi:hypothetical protein
MTAMMGKIKQYEREKKANMNQNQVMMKQKSDLSQSFATTAITERDCLSNQTVKNKESQAIK